MNHLGRLCRELYRDMNLTQRELARRLSISLGKCNSLAKEAEEKGYISVLPGARGLTVKGREYLEQFQVENAVIIAAGIDMRFVPFTHEIPKCLIRVEGERIIERQITQLKEKGVTDITVVVGYLAERFEYLKEKHGVKLLYNAEYAEKNNLATLYHARHLLKNTYLVAADVWLWENMFDEYEPEAWCACHWHEGPTGKWCVETDGRRRIKAVRHGGRDRLAMQGPVHLDKAFSQELVKRIEERYHQPGSEDDRWESVLNTRMGEMQFYANILPAGLVQEFTTFEELRDFDPAYVETSGNRNIRSIAAIFNVPESRITGFKWLDVGMTNQSFRFGLDGQEYIYRIPGEGSENFISRRQEAAVYEAIKPLGLSDEVVYLNPETGIKVAKYYPNSHNVAQDDWESVKTAMQILRRLHTSGLSVEHRFDIIKKAQEFEAMCRKVNCIRFENFEETKKNVELAFDVIRNTEEPWVLAHCDSAHVNFLVKEDGELCLLDWEYAGMCHGIADVAMYGVFSNYSFDKIDDMAAWYYGRKPTPQQRLLCFAYVAASGFLWSMWAVYREYYGEDFGEYAMEQYRIAKNGSALVRQLLL